MTQASIRSMEALWYFEFGLPAKREGAFTGTSKSRFGPTSPGTCFSVKDARLRTITEAERIKAKKKASGGCQGGDMPSSSDRCRGDPATRMPDDA